jgi:hypothetical protein
MPRIPTTPGMSSIPMADGPAWRCHWLPQRGRPIGGPILIDSQRREAIKVEEAIDVAATTQQTLNVCPIALAHKDKQLSRAVWRGWLR